MLLLLACSPKPAEPVAPAEAAPAELRLVVLVVVDQLPTRLWDTTAPWFRGGLARLNGDGAIAATGHYAHASTLTCPGHATISTGVSPAVHGIVSNDWFDPVAGKGVYCGDPALLRAPTVADAVLAGGGLVSTVSVKDRAALMLAGSKGEASWLDRATGRFTGAAAGLDLAPYVAAEWTPLYPERYAALFPDAGPREIDPGTGTTFPHPGGVPKAFPTSPGAGTAVTDAALAVQEARGLGLDDEPDLLGISYSHIDAIGHMFTGESWESLDALLRLDDDLGRLFDALDARVGRDRYAVVLASDHGSVRPSGVAIGVGAVARAGNEALTAAGFAGEVTVEEPNVWLPNALPAADRARAAGAVATAIRSLPGIAEAWAWRSEASEGPFRSAIEEALDDERSGDVYVVLAEGALYDWAGAEGKGTSHGSPWPDEARVPVRILAPGFRSAQLSGDVDMRQIAPTVAALLGAPPVGTASPLVER